MRIILFLALLFSGGLFAQGGELGGGKSFSVPPASGNLNVAPSGISIKNPIIFPSPGSGTIQEKELNSSFGKPSEFQNPGAKVEEKLNKKDGEVETTVRKNLYLGDVKTKSAAVKIIYRDHGNPDGDLVRIHVNDAVVVKSVQLEHEFKTLDLPLLPGFNKIDFEALNAGFYWPNTAEFQIYDDKGVLISSNRWNLAEGFKATVIVVKE